MLVEFSIYWKSRLFLVLIGAFWVVSPFTPRSRCDNPYNFAGIIDLRLVCNTAAVTTS